MSNKIINDLFKIRLEKPFYVLLFLLIWAATSTAQEGTPFSQPNLSIKGKKVDNQIVLRWAPGDYDTWTEGMDEGYRVMCKKLNESGEVLFYALSDTILPQSENTWGNLLQNEWKGMAHALLYDMDEVIYEGAQGAYTQQDDRENRFGFALFAADLSVEVAQLMGLAFIDTLPEVGVIYEFQVFITDHSAASLPIRIDPSETDTLPQPESLNAVFADGEMLLSWHKGNLEQYYTSYIIEYSTDGGITFQSMNDRPFVNLESTTDEESTNDFFFYRAEIDNDITEYQFRVKGVSMFGEVGPVSAIVAGHGQPAPLPLLPLITEVTEMQDSSFQITWQLNENYADSISHINVWRYDTYPGDHILINSTPLDPSTRSFSDPYANDVNYYRIEAVDIFGSPSFSPVALTQRTDSIPPLPPTGLTGYVDTILDSVSIIRLTWNPNTEDDLAGYHVYTSNGPNDEFSILTSSGTISDTFYMDSIYNFTLGDLIFYQIKAVDFNGNQSDTSVMISVERPDLLPPVPPVFREQPNKSNTGLSLSWINSTSSDVVSYELQRKPVGSTEDWETLMTSNAKKKKAEFLDPSVGPSYWYRVVVTDDAGLQAISDTLKVEPTPMEKRMVPPQDYGLATKKQGNKVVIKWLNNAPEEAANFVIYRKKNNGPILSLARIPIDELSSTELNGQSYFIFTDEFCEEGNTYSYCIQLCFTSGNNSNVSPPSIVNF